jgi:hypothetical protein
MTGPELESMPHPNILASRPLREDVAAAAAALHEVCSLEQGGEDPLGIRNVPRLAQVLSVNRITAEQAARVAGAMAALEEGEDALAPVPGRDLTRQPLNLISPRERKMLALVVAGWSNVDRGHHDA